MNTIDEIVEEGIKLLCPYDNAETETGKLRKEAFRCYLLLAKGIGEREAYEEAKRIINSVEKDR